MFDNITINAHSSIRIDLEGTVLYFDPFRIEDEAHDADIIFLTHPHYDHYSPEDIEKIRKPETIFVTPYDIYIDQRVSLVPGSTTLVKGIKAETVPAYNIGKAFHPKDNGWLGYVVEYKGTRMYVAGDTDATPEAGAVRCDVALVPVGGTYTMTAEEAASLVNAIRPRCAIPTHYGSIVGTPEDGEKFKKLVDKDIEVVLKI